MAEHPGQEGNEPKPGADPQERNWRKLEDRAKTAEERAAQLERELAFNKAGLTDLSDLQVKALVATHEGEMTADALKAQAKALGFLPEPTPQPQPEPQPQQAPQGQPGQPAPTPSTAELAEMARLSATPGDVAPAPDGRPQVDFSQFETRDQLLDFLQQNVEWVQPQVPRSI